jgi:hypothetical protein
VFSSNHKFFEPFKVLFWFLLLFVTLTAFLCSANIAHCYAPSFAWDANTEPDIAGYRVFYREEGRNYDFNNPEWEGTENTCTLYGLYDNTTYYFVVKAYDIYGNESESSVELSNAAVGGTITATDGGGGGCFIATTAYGSPIEPHVKLLRQFRDRFLLTNAVGRTFVRLLKPVFLILKMPL